MLYFSQNCSFFKILSLDGMEMNEYFLGNPQLSVKEKHCLHNVFLNFDNQKKYHNFNFCTLSFTVLITTASRKVSSLANIWAFLLSRIFPVS